jgi:hypothetical protein
MEYSIQPIVGEDQRLARDFLLPLRLFRVPESRTSKSGKQFVTATLKVSDGDETQWWGVLAFSESVQAELMRLTDGDAISVQGAFKAELYDKAVTVRPRMDYDDAIPF